MYEGKFKMRARPETLEIGSFSAEGSEGIMVTLVGDGEADEHAAGVEVTWIGWLSDKALPRTVKALQMLGWTGGRTGDDLSNTTGLGSKPVTVILSVRKYQDSKGVDREDQDVYIPLPDDGRKAFQHKRDLGARARALAGAVAAAVNGTSATPAPQARPTPAARPAPAQAPRRGPPNVVPFNPAQGDDELPF